MYSIIEDWWLSINDLIKLWYNENIVDLVSLCTYDKSISDSFNKRKK